MKKNLKKTTKKNVNDQFEIPFWKEWLDGDLLERETLVENLPILNEMVRVGELPKKYQKSSLAMLLNSFFEDLESAMYIRMERSRRKR